MKRANPARRMEAEIEVDGYHILLDGSNENIARLQGRLFQLGILKERGVLPIVHLIDVCDPQAMIEAVKCLAAEPIDERRFDVIRFGDMLLPMKQALLTAISPRDALADEPEPEIDVKNGLRAAAN